MTADPGMQALLNRMLNARLEYDKILKKQDKGEFPTTDEAMQPYYDRMSDTERTIQRQPAASLAGLRIKAQLAVQLLYPPGTAAFRAPHTPEEAYKLVAECQDLSEPMWLISLWADIERFAEEDRRMIEQGEALFREYDQRHQRA